MTDNLTGSGVNSQVVPTTKAQNNDEKIVDWGERAFLIVIFLLAFFVRLFFIYKVSTPDNPGAGWFGDAYHHWQIAYLSQEIGFENGFLRLWDLKGMEFFWGLAHPLLTIFAFKLTGSIDIGIERSLTGFMGSISVVLIYLLVKRFWNVSAAIAAAIFAAFNPVGIFNDTSGMIEPIGIPFLLLGVYLWPKKPFLAGLTLALALTSRAEYWVFSFALITVMLFINKKISSNKKGLLLFGFFLPLIAYMKYLLNYTTNPIYPFYWNYVANIFGTWQHKEVLEPQDIQAKIIFLVILVISAALSVWVIKKKPRAMNLYLLGLGNWVFLGATFGLSAYIKSFATYVWYVRFMIWPYAFLGIILSVFLFYWLPKIGVGKFLNKLKINWIIFILVFVVFQGMWIFIWPKYKSTEPNWKSVVEIGNKIAQHYQGGGLLLMEGNPEITYALVKNNKVEGKNIVGQMFDPYYYFTEDPYLNWGEKREEILNWLVEHNIRTIATYTQTEKYQKLVEKEHQYFSDPIFITDTNIVIYQINDSLYQEAI